MTSLTGHSIIAGTPVAGSLPGHPAVEAATGEALEPVYTFVDEAQLEAATQSAADAFDTYRATSPRERAAFLEKVADEIEADGEQIVARAMSESGLPVARLTGELARTTGQLRMFAGVVGLGDHLEARIDPALPERTPLPRADIRQRQVPLGPVAVFGASNFPLAFSVAGGDTASALAAGCPVVVKAHNAHPGTSELVGAAVTRAVAASGLPAGVFSVVFGSGTSVGQALVRDPRIKAVGFTGSRAGGLALVAAAAARREPIPVYAEMSSVNPVVVLPGSIAEGRAETLATAYVGSLTLGSGQFCTNPGLTFVPSGPDGDAFVAAAARAVAAATGQTMLTSGIAQAYDKGIDALRAASGVSVEAEGAVGHAANAPAPLLASTTTAGLRDESAVSDEVFGAAGVVVRWGDEAELAAALRGLEGQLTVTVQAADGDHETARSLLPLLETKAGRILFNGWPTGVEVGHAMVHGGPFPATSDSRTTSVGSLAIYRFQRPVAYQDVPAGLLPEPTRDDNPWGVTQRIDGRLRPAQD
ncbi:aldehyde dehydrogenase (NADP(+)) [Terrabacter sp. MAHUQ-38]|uniref:aldehyde dehydrogenase (NADP(+)) n=1 Tax=unclassified Terrabacter TaxID=2630222 RepID=UPI00165E0EA8|nr:aldehyde dehydrogenase (NADP(+)) [Terrabacter sp. MAHUQ-38]MBC9819963.1 aldehyde dehydrogenase (NADP(+)) [Terrabacter sp. MAHUQ-38]